VPERTTLVARGSGGMGHLALEITEPGKPTVRIEPPKPEAAKDSDDAGKPKDGKAPAKRVDAKPIGAKPVAGTAQAANDTKAADDVGEIKAELRKSATVKLLSGTTTVATWQFTVTPDLPPLVSLTKEPERTLRGALRIPYKVEDDYGVSSLEARFTRAPQKEDTSRTAWARAERAKIKGPRPPLERPPVLQVRLNATYPKTATGISLHELGDHLWTGLPVRMQLVAKDLAGQTGKSDPYTMIMPARTFRKTLAKALIEQRLKLIEDPRQKKDVMYALGLITDEPQEFMKDLKVYTGLRNVYHRLAQDRRNDRSVRNSAIKQLWAIAVRVEDGSLSDAERNLREIQERLSQALRDGASDEEIQKLMQELRQAMAEFMQELERQAENNPQQDNGQQQQGQTYSQRDIEQMMRNIEDMMRSGNKEMAEQMLSELRDLMERLQSGRMAQGQQGQGGQQSQMNEMMNELGELLNKQQQLLDETFQQQQGPQGPQGQPGQQGQQGPGQQGQQGPGQRGQQGQRGPGQQGQGQGQPGQRGQQPGQGQQGQNRGQQDGPGQGGENRGQEQGGPGGMANRQEALRDMLDKLQRGMGGMGMQPPEQFGQAGDAMREAQEALRRGDMAGAADAENRALEKLREGAQGMAREMARQMQRGQQQGQGQQGPNGDPSRLDPLGRAPNEGRVDGSDPGILTTVPDQIDAQRAREILEELRKRLGDQQRTPAELEYIERLLKRF
jgi:uncharacterized protein (TIGR02302 family)